MDLPFSQASENNKDPILEVLSGLFLPGQLVLEIGSGTAQHAVYFSRKLPGIRWQTADREENLWAIRRRVEQAGLTALLSPLELDASTFNWSAVTPDHVFSANTAHIMSWDAVCAMFKGVGSILGGGVFVLYGPFNRNGEFTSPSNRTFDQSLRNRNPEMGIRDDAALVRLAHHNGLELAEDIAMPANNRILVWNRAPEHSGQQ